MINISDIGANTRDRQLLLQAHMPAKQAVIVGSARHDIKPAEAGKRFSRPQHKHGARVCQL